MLLLPDIKAAECYARAARARQVALELTEPLDRAVYFAAEERWRKLGEKYQFLASVALPDLLKVSIDYSPHPRCTVCEVPMWPVSAPKDRRHYECKVCDATLVLTEVNRDGGVSIVPTGPLEANATPA